MSTSVTERRSIATVLIVAAVVVFVAIVVSGVGGAIARNPAAVCDTLADPTRPGAGSVAGYSGEQLVNAATIMNVATDMGLDVRAQQLGVMAAMGESGLRNLPYGDYQTSGALNPDGTPTSSLGLFQQQDWWGTQDERLDPATSAGLFFQKLVTVDGWEWRPASAVIHDVQINTDPDHYASYEDAATQVTAAISSCS